jgi:mannose-6-phosphate isomerase-like protein (cupin superfamily)
MDMENTLPASKKMPLPHMVPAGEDRFGESKNLGISSVAFKITAQESSDLFAVEITLVQKGGPARHVHYHQDEWWYVVEGEFILEVGDKRFHGKPGDSFFGPRNIPHVWAFVEGTRGRLLGSVMPAGNLEAFFIAGGMKKVVPGPDPNNWQPYGMEWVGPPLMIE